MNDLENVHRAKKNEVGPLPLHDIGRLIQMDQKPKFKS